MIRSVSAENVAAVWPTVEKYIEAACKYANGTLYADEVYSRLLAKEMQLFVCGDIDGAFVTEILHYKRKTVLRGVSIGGEFGACDFAEITETLKNWAKELGATVELVGRPGWVRALKKHGWKQTSVIMEVENG